MLEDALNIEKEGETEAKTMIQTNKGDEDGQIDEGKVEEHEVTRAKRLHGRISCNIPVTSVGFPLHYLILL